jgi:hypothetical protein
MKIVVIIAAKPAIIVWNNQNNQGARKIKVNSIASLTPVNELTIAPGITIDPQSLRLSPLGAANNIPNAAPGRPNIPQTKAKSVYCPGTSME